MNDEQLKAMGLYELSVRCKERALREAEEKKRADEIAREKAFHNWKNGENVKCVNCNELFYAKQNEISWRKMCGPCYYASKK